MTWLGSSGSQGGLVPGVTVYAYAGHALFGERSGPAGPDQGVTRVRFLTPCYDGEELVVSVTGSVFEVTAGERRMRGRLGLPFRTAPAAVAGWR